MANADPRSNSIDFSFLPFRFLSLSVCLSLDNFLPGSSSTLPLTFLFLYLPSLQIDWLQPNTEYWSPVHSFFAISKRLWKMLETRDREGRDDFKLCNIEVNCIPLLLHRVRWSTNGAADGTDWYKRARTKRHIIIACRKKTTAITKRGFLNV